MTTTTTKNTLALSYKKLDTEGLLKAKSVVINDLNVNLEDEDLYEIALLIKDILAFGVEKIIKRSEMIFLED